MMESAKELVAEARKRITEVDVEQAQALLGKALVLDVREPHEYLAGSLPGAINIPRGVLEFKIDSHPEFKDRPEADILVYCRTGGRGALATEALQKLGYRHAVNLVGGFEAWRDSGKAVATPAAQAD